MRYLSTQFHQTTTPSTRNWTPLHSNNTRPCANQITSSLRWLLESKVPVKPAAVLARDLRPEETRSEKLRVKFRELWYQYSNSTVLDLHGAIIHAMYSDYIGGHTQHIQLLRNLVASKQRKWPRNCHMTSEEFACICMQLLSVTKNNICLGSNGREKRKRVLLEISNFSEELRVFHVPFSSVGYSRDSCCTCIHVPYMYEDEQYIWSLVLFCTFPFPRVG